MALFEIANAPGETRNIDGDHPEVVSRLGKRLNIWKDSLPNPTRSSKALVNKTNR